MGYCLLLLRYLLYNILSDMLNPKTFYKSFGYALDGLKLALELDQNVRIHFVIALIVITFSLYFRITTFEFLFVIFSIFFVVITELMNTAIEEMTNLIVQEHRREAKIAKDVAAAAVLLSAVFALTVGLIVFIPHFLALL